MVDTGIDRLYDKVIGRYGGDAARLVSTERLIKALQAVMPHIDWSAK